MKKLTGHAVLALSLVLFSQAARADCSPKDIDAKALEISDEVQRLTPMLGKSVDASEYYAELGKLAHAGKAVADEDLDRACSIYDEFLAWAKAQKE